MAMAPRRPVLIAGGGIGGLAAALALARAGWPSHIAERRAEWSEAGAGIQLSPNGVAVLKRLGLDAVLAPDAGRPQEIVVREAGSARVLQRLPLGAWIATRHGSPYWQVHRRDLQAALLARIAAEPLITTTRGYDASFFLDDGATVTLRTRDGATLEGCALIGADGVFSRVRQQMWGAHAPRFSGRTATRTVIPVAGSGATGGVVDATTTGVWLAPGAHIVHYPVRGGRELAIVVIRTEPWHEAGWSAPVASAEMAAFLRGVAPALAEVLSAALGSEHDWRRWALFELEPPDRWSKGRATLLGDAAHPTLPFLAQGGSLALEDAWTLAASLAGIDATDGTAIASGLAAYERARMSRTRRVVAAARRNGWIFHLAGAAALGRNAIMALAPGHRVMASYDWVYGWRPE